MKTLLFAGAALALLTATNFSPAMAQGPKLSGGDTWPGISQRVDPDASIAAAATPRYAMAQGPKLSGGNTWPGISQRADPDASIAAAATPRYELQYGYDKHATWRGHWLPVR
jgi:hypothetical protein